MIDDDAPIARLYRVLFSSLVALAFALALLGESVAAPTTGDSAGLAGAVAQDNVATLSTTWKVARSLEHRSKHDPDGAFLPVSPIVLPERAALRDVRQTDAVLRIVSGIGLPQSRAPPLT